MTTDPKTNQDIQTTLHNTAQLSNKLNNILGGNSKIKVQGDVGMMYNDTKSKTSGSANFKVFRNDAYALLGADNIGDDTKMNLQYGHHDGTVQATLGDGTTIVANDCEGTLDFSSYPAIYGDVTATVDGHALSASGHYTSARQYDGTIKADAVKAAYVSQFIPDTVAVTVTDGSIEHERLHYDARRHDPVPRFEGSPAGPGWNAYSRWLEADPFC